MLGDDVNGIWEKYTNTDDINAADVYADTIVTGDDFSKVRLLRFPCFKKGCVVAAYNVPLSCAAPVPRPGCTTDTRHTSQTSDLLPTTHGVTDSTP